MHEVHAPSAFTRCHDELIALSEDGAVASKVGSGDYTYRTAASGVAMRGGGRYYAAFTIVKYVSYTLFGIIRPSFWVEGGAFPHDVEGAGHWFYSTGSGRRSPGPNDEREWEGIP